MSQGFPDSPQTERESGHNPAFGSVDSPTTTPGPLDTSVAGGVFDADEAAAETLSRAASTLRPVAPPAPMWGASRTVGLSSTGGGRGSTGARDASERLFAAAPPRHEAREASRGRGVITALNTLLRERRRLLLSVVAVALGVGYLAGALSLLNRVSDGLALQAGASGERADIVIEGVVATSGPLQEVRRLVSNALVTPVSAIDGIAAIEPRLESKSTVIFSAGGERIVGLGLTERPMGANFPADDAMNPYRFVGEGQPPDAPDEVAIDAGSASVGNIAVGDSIDIAAKSSIASYRVTGIVEPIVGSLPDGSSLALFDEETARSLFDLGADNNAIAIRVEDGADVDAVLEQIQTVVGSAAEVVTGETYAEHRRASFERSFLLIRALLVGFAGLALVVGSFTVANSMSLLFEHRRRGFAMLRLMGASPAQLNAAAVGEALVGGAVAGAVGLVVGLGIGLGIERAIGATGTAIPTAGPLLSWWIPIVALLVGMAVTVGTSLGPAREAARTPPVMAVTGYDPRTTTARRRDAVLKAGRTLLVVAIGGCALGWFLGGLAMGAVVAGIGVALALVLVLLPRLLSRLVGVATSLMLGTSIALRRMSALRSAQARNRAASTTGALLLATTVVAGLVIIGSSFVASVEGEIAETVTADLIIDSQTFTNGGLDVELIPSIRSVPGVSSATAWSVGAATIGDRKYRIGGVTGSALLESLDLRFRDGAPAEFGPTDFVVSESVADATALSVGQQVTVSLDSGGPLTLRLVGIYDSSLSSLIGEALIDHDTLHQRIPLSADILGFVRFADDAPESVEADVRAVAERFRAPSVLEPSELIAERADYLNGFSKVIQWMLAFSIVLALVGVANTLQLGVNERRREIGLLRSVGATRGQVLRLVLTEAAALSLVGSVIGSLVGIAGASAAVAALRDFGMSTLVIPWGNIVAITLGALALSLLCAVVPSMAAVRIPPLEAISEVEQRSRRRRSTAPRHHHAEEHRSGATVDGVRTPPSDVREFDQGEKSVRCFACGTDPGAASTCPVCGTDLSPHSTLVGAAPQAVEVDGGNEARTTGRATKPPLFVPPPRGLAEPALDITDAEIVEDLVEHDDAHDDEPVVDAAIAAADAAASDPATSLFGAGDDDATAPPRIAKFGARDDRPAAEQRSGLFGPTATEELPSSIGAGATSVGSNGADDVAALAVDDLDSAAFETAAFETAASETAAFDKAAFETDDAVIADALIDAMGLDDVAAGDADPFATPHAAAGGAMFSAGAQPPSAAPPATPSPSSTVGGGASAVPPAYARPAQAQPVIAEPITVEPVTAQRAAARVAEAPPRPEPRPEPQPEPRPEPQPADPLATESVQAAEDPHGIAGAVALLDAESRIAGSVSFAVAGALLDADESVDGLLVGRSLGMVTILVATDRKVLVISERGFSPEVERFALDPTLQVHGRTANAQASVTLIQDGTVLTVDQIREVGLAVHVADQIRARTSR